MRIIVEFLCQSSSSSYAKALTQGTTRHPYTRKMFMCGWVSLQATVDFPEGSQFRNREITAPGQATVKNRGNMPVAEEEYIFSDTIHLEGRIVLHYLEIERSKEVGTAQGTTGVAALNAMNHSYDVSPYLCSGIF